MKRIAAGVVAAATALSLSTGVASAAGDPNAQNGSSNDSYTTGYIVGSIVKEAAGQDGMTSSVEEIAENSKADGNRSPLFSSFKSDAANGWKLGTTFDILWGTGVAVAVLGAAYTAVQNGLIPGVSLPF
ncbi:MULTISPECIES: hypothetical protein [Corynebacterium]|uniref:hypothetical protein n=1 Tax=Corynebacterium TaxID=1716 RepID=UPI000AD563C6|nr:MULTISPECIES: hypothetical protein [Corynebacterium]MCZ9298915.1 hypothetical protein [Corynebacterium hesseae]MDK8897336.1 hypothetical protein [Corynebacterium sp. MSK004]